MLTRGTEHLSLNEYTDKFFAGGPGTSIVYAVGDLAYSRDLKASAGDTRELHILAEKVFNGSLRGAVFLTQRRLPGRPFVHVGAFKGGASYEYIATKSRGGVVG